MPNDLTVSRLLPTNAVGTLQATANQPAGTATAPPAGAAVTPSFANPDIHIDPATNLVVIQFRSDGGALLEQIPTRQQLQAYRQGATLSTD